MIRILLENAYPIDLIFRKMNCRIKKFIRRLSEKKPEQKLEKKE